MPLVHAKSPCKAQHGLQKFSDTGIILKPAREKRRVTIASSSLDDSGFSITIANSSLDHSGLHITTANSKLDRSGLPRDILVKSRES